jgi:stage III sporulation protein AF
MNSYNKEYVDSVNELADKTGNNSLTKGYEDGVKQVLQLKLDEYGYELEDIKFKGSNIENIKLKNNSNKSVEEDIQFNENEKSQQVFKDKGTSDNSSQELNLSEENLKDNLIEILDVSIETIQID